MTDVNKNGFAILTSRHHLRPRALEGMARKLTFPAHLSKKINDSDFQARVERERRRYDSACRRSYQGEFVPPNYRINFTRAYSCV